MPDYSIKLPHITEVTITKAKELLAFAALPYYQASGNLLAGEGAVAIGDPIAWDTSEKKYIKYDIGETVVASEDAVGTEDGTLVLFFASQDNIKPGTLVVKIDGAPVTEGADFIANYEEGYVIFAVAPGGAEVVTFEYTHYANIGSDLGKAVGFVRIPGDAGVVAEDKYDVAIEVLIGGAVKYSIVSDPDGENWNDHILEDLGAKYWEIADALIW